jgi:uncharacterized membrane protein YphA (DoxX/SURF4 family)
MTDLALPAAPYLVLFGRVTLGLVFALSGGAKLADLHGFVASVGEFRQLPEPLVRPFAIAVVFAEFALAALLVAGAAVELALIVALILLAVFTIVVVRSLRAGQVVTCRCFGQLSRRPVSWGAVLRNLALMWLALVTLGADLSAGVAPVSAADALSAGLLFVGMLAALAFVSQAVALLRREPN